jgi:PHD/YefM family antitoxin component YafN of YafNO toxin-antitoxin module
MLVMTSIKEQYVVDEKGKRRGVLIGMKEYRRILAELEELESIRAYDAAKASKEEAIPFEQAVKEIERKRK